MTAKVRAFLHFWYDFVVGDDWQVAAGVAVALGLTYAISRTSAPAWWIMPVAVVLLLTLSLWRATREHRNGKVGE
jgi:hypothetical protein